MVVTLGFCACVEWHTRMHARLLLVIYWLMAEMATPTSLPELQHWRGYSQNMDMRCIAKFA